MLQTTTSSRIPWYASPSKGGACSVYHSLTACFTKVLDPTNYSRDGTKCQGVLVNEWGQTVTASSMYKWFDLFCDASLASLCGGSIHPWQNGRCLDGTIDSGVSLRQSNWFHATSFDLFTRPPLHMSTLVTNRASSPISGCFRLDPYVLLQRPVLLIGGWPPHWPTEVYWPPLQNTTSGRFQSRAAGTGGSTPPFLKLFLTRQFALARNFANELGCSHMMYIECRRARGDICHVRKFDEFEGLMGKL
jgi:hypothetical protein